MHKNDARGRSGPTLTTVIFVFAFAAMVLPGPAAASGPADFVADPAPVALKPQAEVDDSVIRLGDLFTGAGEHAGEVIAYAPEPGHTHTFEARWLARAARYYRLDWRPASGLSRITVTRATSEIEAAEIETAILQALDQDENEGALTIELDNPLMSLRVPGYGPFTIVVESARRNPYTGRFQVIVSVPAGETAAVRTRVSGRAYRIVQVPVLSERKLREEIIAERDIVWLDVRAERLPVDTVVDADALIGMASKRGLRAGVPLRRSDIAKPRLVRRGTMVTIRLNHGPMALSARGRALENGAFGDVIRVSNSRSKQVIEATVDGDGSVYVRLAPAGSVPRSAPQVALKAP